MFPARILFTLAVALLSPGLRAVVGAESPGERNADRGYTSDIPDGAPVTEAPVHLSDPYGKVLMYRKNRDSTGRVEHLIGVRFFDKQGKRVKEVPWRDDRQEGTERTWHPDGTPAGIRLYHGGLLDGQCRQWDVRGGLLGSFSMRAGTGVYREWHDNGRLSKEGFYRGGKPHGAQREWREDGTLVQEEAFEHGQLQGASRFYFPNGRLMQEIYYWGGRSHGVLYTWDQGGNFVDGAPRFFVNGKQVLRNAYDEACRNDPRLPPHPSDWPDGEKSLRQDPFLVNPATLNGATAEFGTPASRPAEPR